VSLDGVPAQSYEIELGLGKNRRMKPTALDKEKRPNFRSCITTVTNKPVSQGKNALPVFAVIPFLFTFS
jgi:hypothetical protein